MNKQTAVDYLLHELHAAGFIEDITDPLLIQRVNEALQMEREQIKDAWFDGRNPEGKMFFGDYYERNYGKEASHEG